MLLEELFYATFLVSLTAAGIVQLARLLPYVQRAMLAGKKPWVCNLCMSWWTTWIAAVVFGFAKGHAPFETALPAFALTLLIVNTLGAPQSKPDFDLDEIPEEAE